MGEPVPQTVMVVDDDQDIVDLTRLVLEGGGYRVIAARSGTEALQKLQASRPSLILFSIKMEVRDKLRGLQDGAYDYISKPFSHDELLGRVQRIFETLQQGRVPA
jgi:CheY-like chemotaxis protein